MMGSARARLLRVRVVLLTWKEKSAVPNTGLDDEWRNAADVYSGKVSLPCLLALLRLVLSWGVILACIAVISFLHMRFFSCLL
jgi:hypothetical protein